MPQDKIVQRILQRQAELSSNRDNWTNIWRECSTYALPRIQDKIDTITTEGKEHSDLYDSSAQIYAEKLANSLFSFMTPSSVKWFEWSTGDEKLDAQREVATYLRNVENILFTGLGKSNFYTQAHESDLDAVVLGTTIIMAEENDSDAIPVRYYAAPVYRTSLGSSKNNEIDSLYMEYEMTGYQLNQKYPDVFDRKREADLNAKYKLVHAIEPKENFFVNEEEEPFGVKNFISYVVLVDRAMLLTDLKEGYNSFPAGVGMFYRSTDETYGRSPTMRCLADIRSLNLLRKSYLTGTQLASAPPLQVKHNSIVANRVIFKPFGLTYVKGDSEIKPLITGARPDIGDATIERLQNSVGLAFYQDVMQMTRKTHQLEDQVASFNDEQIRSLSAVFVRMTKMYEVIINRTFEIYENKGLLPAAPDILKDRPEIRIRYKSQLARAQKQSEIQNILQGVNIIAQIAQIDPSVTAVLDGQETVRVILETLDVDRRIFRSKKQAEAIEKEQQDAMRDQQEAETQNVQADSISKLSQ